jgi:hypothetical protein
MTERKFKVGDLIHEQHYPERMGVVTRVVQPDTVVVEWVVRNPNSYSPGPEEILERYLVLLSRSEDHG